jgi:hypothetical protein
MGEIDIVLIMREITCEEEKQKRKYNTPKYGILMAD